jgi:hypothetical protein
MLIRNTDLKLAVSDLESRRVSSFPAPVLRRVSVCFRVDCPIDRLLCSAVSKRARYDYVEMTEPVALIGKRARTVDLAPFGAHVIP